MLQNDNQNSNKINGSADFDFKMCELDRTESLVGSKRCLDDQTISNKRRKMIEDNFMIYCKDSGDSSDSDKDSENSEDSKDSKDSKDKTTEIKIETSEEMSLDELLRFLEYMKHLAGGSEKSGNPGNPGDSGDSGDSGEIGKTKEPGESKSVKKPVNLVYEIVPVEGVIDPSVSSVLNRESPFKIKTLGELIKLCNSDVNIRKYPDLAKLKKIKEPLEELNNLIGMKSIKASILDQILFYCQGLQTDKEMRHVIITGPPGVGKTTICHILAKIYAGLGELEKGHIVSCKRSDLIGKYLGFTSVQTAEVIESSFGGVLLIDEAYSLGNPRGSDSYAKECLDMINRYLSEHSDKFICIIVGYKEALETSFFSYNPGLARRFTWNFNINSYDPSELKEIFLKVVSDNKWRIEKDIPNLEFFKKNKNKFPNFGGDVNTLFSKCCIASSRRTFGLQDFFKRKITKSDVKRGFEIYLKNQDKIKDDNPPPSMYN